MKPTIPQSWQDRLAIINEFKMSNTDAVVLFATTERELAVARGLVEKGLMKVPTLNEETKQSWSSVMGTSTSQPIASSVQSAPQPSAVVSTVQSAKPTKHRGRQGTKIVAAFSNLTSTPEPVDVFVKKHGVSKTILRQSKRFLDSPIKVSIKRDKNTKQEMICRL